MNLSMKEQDLVERVRTLPPEKLAEVIDFVDFLQHRSEFKKLTQEAMKLSEASFQRVWDNPEDSVYDNL